MSPSTSFKPRATAASTNFSEEWKFAIRKIGIAPSNEEQISRELAVAAERCRRFQSGVEAIGGTESCEREDRCKEFRIRSRREIAVGIPIEERFAGVAIRDEDAPIRFSGVSFAQQRFQACAKPF
jgi:hypothetical protein